MADPFLAEIRLLSFTFAPRGWASCDGQLLPISQNQALFSLLGTTFGGNGSTSFALPDLRGRTPMHAGNGYQLGDAGGAAGVALTTAQIPAHTHTAQAAQEATATGPEGAYPGNPASPIYAAPGSLTPMNAGAVGTTGSGQPHPNMQPFLAVTFCIALQGMYPTRS